MNCFCNYWPFYEGNPPLKDGSRKPVIRILLCFVCLNELLNKISNFQWFSKAWRSFGIMMSLKVNLSLRGIAHYMRDIYILMSLVFDLFPVDFLLLSWLSNNNLVWWNHTSEQFSVICTENRLFVWSNWNARLLLLILQKLTNKLRTLFVNSISVLFQCSKWCWREHVKVKPKFGSG